MNRKIFIGLIAFASTICIQAQPQQWELDTTHNYMIPKGICLWDNLKQGEFFAEMQEYYTQYQPKQTVMESLAAIFHYFKGKKQEVDQPQFHDVVIYFGAWCGDSREQLPAFIKICDLLQKEYQISIPYTLIACTKAKQHGLEKNPDYNFEIQLVPTFVFRSIQNDNSSTNAIKNIVGTIVETPQISIEEDMIFILNKLIQK